MNHQAVRAAILASAMSITGGAFAADVKPLGSPLDDALGRGSLLALAAVALVLGIAIVRRKQAR